MKAKTQQEDPKRVKLSSKLRTKYIGLNRNRDMMFKTTSGTTPGKFWYQTIRFHDLQAAIDLFGDDKDVTDHDIADLITHGDISVHCNCPSWKYWGWQYVGTKHGFAIQPETRKPVKNNPGQKGAVCKHIYTAIKSQPFI